MTSWSLGWARLRRFTWRRIGGSESHLHSHWGAVIHAGYRPSTMAALQSPKLLTLITHPCLMELAGFPRWTLVELHLAFIVGIERGEVDIVCISQGRDSQQQKYLQMSVFLMKKFIKLPVGSLQYGVCCLSWFDSKRQTNIFCRVPIEG